MKKVINIETGENANVLFNLKLSGKCFYASIADDELYLPIENSTDEFNNQKLHTPFTVPCDSIGEYLAFGIIKQVTI